MSNSALALVGFVGWTLLLLLVLASMRTSLVLAGRRRANEFQPDGADVSPFSNRLCRAHANCYENLPLFASLVLLAIATDATRLTDPLALWFLAARVAQSVTHLASTSALAVQARFTFFLVQYGILGWWVFQFLAG